MSSDKRLRYKFDVGATVQYKPELQTHEFLRGVATIRRARCKKRIGWLYVICFEARPKHCMVAKHNELNLVQYE